MDLLHLTIAICTHNRAELLLKTIESICAANFFTDSKVSLLVIANACSDDTLEKLKTLEVKGQTIPIAFDEEPTPGKSHALGRAISLIKAGFICFIDDDHRVDQQYFSEVSHAINKYPDAAIFCGKIIPDWTGSEPDWIHNQGHYKIYPLPVPHFELGEQAILVTQDMKLPGGGNLIVNRNVFDQVAPFSTKLGPKGHNLTGSEDSEFLLRALKAKIIIQYVPEIIQYHYVDEQRLKFSYLIRKSFQRTRSFTKSIHSGSQPVPLYLWRKLFNYSCALLISFKTLKIRFYAMRIASTLGEIVGLQESE